MQKILIINRYYICSCIYVHLVKTTLEYLNPKVFFRKKTTPIPYGIFKTFVKYYIYQDSYELTLLNTHIRRMSLFELVNE